MSGEMTTAITALVVALISAGVGIHNGRTTAKVQRWAQQTQESNSRDRERREANARYISAAEIFEGICWELAQELDGGRSPERCEALYEKVEQRGHDLSAARATVMSVASAPVEKEAEALYKALTALDNEVSDWCSTLRKQGWENTLRGRRSRFNDVKARSKEARRKFDLAIRQEV